MEYLLLQVSSHGSCRASLSFVNEHGVKGWIMKWIHTFALGALVEEARFVIEPLVDFEHLARQRCVLGEGM